MNASFAGFLKDKVRLATVLILTPVSLSLFASFHWTLELSSHFMPHYCAALVLCGIALLGFRDFRWSAVAAAGALVAALPVAPWYFQGSLAQAPVGGTPLRIALSNVYTANTQSARVLQLLEEENVDIAVLQEVDDRWLSELEPLKATLPEVKVIARADNFGIGVWSRLKLEEVRVMEMGPFEVPTIAMQVEVGGRRITVIATHPVPPASAEGSEGRNTQLHELAEHAATSKLPVVVVGDLNTTMWAPAYRRFEKESGLKNVRRGFGVLPTWPAPLRWAGIPLDHCMVSPQIAVSDVRVGKPIGSDHLPLIVDLIIPKPAPGAVNAPGGQ